MSRAGYTLIELIVVIGITALLSSIVITYGGAGRQQIVLSIETIKVVQLIARAKSLAVATYLSPAAFCGYGVHFDYAQNKYSLRSYVTSPSCQSVSGITSSEVIEEAVLNPGVAWGEGLNKIDDVIFVPPDPKTHLFSGGVALAGVSGKVYLKTADAQANRTVTVNPAGQITF